MGNSSSALEDLRSIEQMVLRWNRLMHQQYVETGTGDDVPMGCF